MGVRAGSSLCQFPHDRAQVTNAAVNLARLTRRLACGSFSERNRQVQKNAAVE